ncbi:MAG: hypothetical protein DSZ32_00860 [Gammaproteobacteria bacterium]|nr:MAG: hypothetical protein DSZ32_00860 [Gammaproteobacteria bacterium]
MAKAEITAESVTTIDQPSLTGRIANAIKGFASFSELLRMVGAGIVVASMSSFMLQDWGSGNDIQRYFLLLMQSALLAAGGFAMSYVLRENKGARIFFGLSLISITANFTILGALVYSLAQWDAGLTRYPGFAHWVATSPQSLMLTLGAALAVMLPLLRFGFMVMARPAAGRLTLLYLLMNSLLLLPVRGSVAVSLLVICALLALTALAPRVLGAGEHLSTPGGRFAQALLYAPLLVLIGRSALLYAPDAFLYLAVSSAVFLGLRAFSQQHREDKSWNMLADSLAYIAVFYVASSLETIAGPLIGSRFALSVFAITIAALTLDLTHRGDNATLNRIMTLFTGAVVALSFVLSDLGHAPFAAALMSMAAGAGLIGYGWMKKEKALMVFGLAPMGVASYDTVSKLWHFLFSNNWISLAVVGITAIIIASVLERHGAVLKLKLEQWRR